MMTATMHSYVGNVRFFQLLLQTGQTASGPFTPSLVWLPLLFA